MVILFPFYDPPPNKLVTLPYEELEKVLDGRYTLPSEEQLQTREPILKDRDDVPNNSLGESKD